MPKTPYGYYRSWAQACDSQGAQRTHCAYAADAGGICKQRGDHWDPREFNNLIRAATGLLIWYNTAAYDLFPGQHVAACAIHLSARYDPTNVPTLRGWANYWNQSTGLPETLYFVTDPGFFVYYRLRDMTHAIYSDPMWLPYISMGYHFVIAGPDVLGNPWLNAI